MSSHDNHRMLGRANSGSAQLPGAANEANIAHPSVINIVDRMLACAFDIMWLVVNTSDIFGPKE